MKTGTIGFVGGGRITRIFLEGWQRAQKLPAKVTVSDPNGEVLKKLQTRFPQIEITGENAAAESWEVVFLAVHPPAMAEAAASIKAHLKPDALVVSLAPKFTTSKLAELLGGFARIARVIPNAPSVMNFGFNPVAFSPSLGVSERETVLELLAPLGECPEVEETKLEAYAVLTAMAPTFFWHQFQHLREVAAGFGLSESEINPALKRMVCGSARTLLESGLGPAEVMDLVPVKPLSELEPQAAELYRSRLPALYQKIKP